MPLYEYRCLTCGKTFELLRRIQDSDRDLKCPECLTGSVERLLSTFSTSSPSGCAPSGSGKFT